MLDEITRPNNPGSSNSVSLIPTLLEHLNKIQEKPITVHSDHNLKVLVEDNRSVQVSMESASEYARRTYDNRTLTPQQAVKMRQLE